MSLAFSHGTASLLPSTRSSKRDTILELALAVAFVVLATASILFLATQPSTPETEQMMTAFAQQ